MFYECCPIQTEKRQLCSVSDKKHREDNLLYGKGLGGGQSIILFFIKRMCMGDHQHLPLGGHGGRYYLWGPSLSPITWQ